VTRETQWAMGLRDQVNIHRIGLDRFLQPRLKPLRYHQRITEFAQARADFMVASKTYGHRDQEGRMVAARLAAVGFPYRYATENIAWGQRPDPGKLFEDFFQSAGHRRAIEAPGYVYTGIGIAFDEVGGDYFMTDMPLSDTNPRYLGPAMFVCQVFYTPA
jgi:uncharacterized protein YkwD